MKVQETNSILDMNAFHHVFLMLRDFGVLNHALQFGNLRKTVTMTLSRLFNLVLATFLLPEEVHASLI